MTMSEFEMLSRYWADHPPVHLMVAGYLRIKPKKKSDAKELAEVLSSMTGWSQRMH